MKRLKIVIILLVLAIGAANAQFTKAELQVSGLNCALCAKTTENSLRSLPFILDVKPDLMHNIYVITFKSDKPVNFDQIGNIVHEENFFISFLKATFNFGDVKVTNNYFSAQGANFRVMNADKPLSGEVAFTLVDKGFAPRSVTKKYSGLTANDNPVKIGRVYHVAI
ncbi:heavy-metal-associated domain-containing protein [Mucilaginibacter sp.]|uniref:heavy-metal-associated domain-containing protein n=1 Tax=Mucilaginibacter sp. TaxID=1882438 RepID=UPI00284DBF4C|nr:heavy-metal-associated domain-containing protein [Mucilaginibacter sp.]MDR3695519.1 heavy-metal-associated domain-containing protein [Mucilaginibacter sp.]